MRRLQRAVQPAEAVDTERSEEVRQKNCLTSFLLYLSIDLVWRMG